MGDLRDALKKAGLIDGKKERQLKHQERVHKKKVGRQGLEAERQAKAKAHQQRKKHSQQATKQAQAQHDQEREKDSASKRALARLESEALPGGRGPRRFHYRDRDGALPYLDLSDDVGRRVEAGELAIARRPDDRRVVLVPRAVAQEVAPHHPELILLLAGSGA